MATKYLQLCITIILAALVLAACGTAAPGANVEPTALPPVVAETNVVAEGRLAPRDSVQLAFFTSGQVAEILVEEGDQVEVGEVVARLGDREEIESTIANTEVELLAARQALQKLYDDLPEVQTAVLQAVKDARQALRDAERKVRNLGVTGDALDIEVARANVALAKKALDQAEKDFKPYTNKPESDLRRAALLNRLSEAQDRYDDAVKQLNQLTGEITPEFDLEQAQTELAIAKSRLELATAELELLKDSPDPADVQAAEARIGAAESALAAARAALMNLELHATLSGTVVQQDLVVGQQVSAGQPVMTIADFSQMYAETDDLTEIGVVEVAVGQPASLRADALPELQLAGTVESISQVYEEKRGDITYTTRILLEKTDPRLRWGMTVAITFEK